MDLVPRWVIFDFVILTLLIFVAAILIQTWINREVYDMTREKRAALKRLREKR